MKISDLLAERDHGKTPWNPSRKATKRVPLPHLPMPTVCPHCGGAVECVKNSEIYNGMEYGDWPWAFLCRGCGSYVGLHPFTGIPLGTLATREIREARKASKTEFKKLHPPAWITGRAVQRYPFPSRTEAYEWLAGALKITKEECHFGLFDVARCEAAAAVIKEKLK